MSVVSLTLTNYAASEITLPRELDGAVLAAGASKTFILNADKIAEDDQNVTRPMIAALKNLVASSQGQVVAEDTGVVTAGAAVYNLVAAKRQIVPSTLVVTVIDNAGDPIVLKDNGAGALAQVGGAGTGTVNYLNGAIVLNNDLTGTPGAGDAILLDYIKQEVGVSSIVAVPRNNIALGVPAVDLEQAINAVAAKASSGIRTGQAVLAAAVSVAVVLDPPAPNATYNVQLTPEFAPASDSPPHVTAKTAAGFTVTFAAAQTGTVNWLVIQ
jgi:hypothetical protein